MRAVKDNPAIPLRRVDGVKIWTWAACLLCSCNARPEKALVGRAQWESMQHPLFRAVTSKLGGMIGSCDPQRALLDRDSVSDDSVGEFVLDRDRRPVRNR